MWNQFAWGVPSTLVSCEPLPPEVVYGSSDFVLAFYGKIQPDAIPAAAAASAAAAAVVLPKWQPMLLYGYWKNVEAGIWRRTSFFLAPEDGMVVAWLPDSMIIRKNIDGLFYAAIYPSNPAQRIRTHGPPLVLPDTIEIDPTNGSLKMPHGRRLQCVPDGNAETVVFVEEGGSRGRFELRTDVGTYVDEPDDPNGVWDASVEGTWPFRSNQVYDNDAWRAAHIRSLEKGDNATQVVTWNGPQSYDREAATSAFRYHVLARTDRMATAAKPKQKK